MPWPSDAFKYGIKSMRAPIEFLKPSILDVDRKHDIKSEKATNTIISAEKYWSITNLSRAQYMDSKTLTEVILNKLNCRFTKLSLLSKAMKKRLQLDLTNTTHCVSLGPLKLLSLCSKCGQSHSEKNCKELNCYRCQCTDHTALNCNNEIKCINCGGPHLCTSDLCIYLVKKSVEEHNFIVNFELNEGIIAHPVQLFKTRITPDEYDNYYTEKSDPQQIIVDKLRVELLNTIIPVVDKKHDEIKSKLTEKFSIYDNKFAKLDEYIKTNNDKLDNMYNDIKSNSNDLKSNANLLKKLLKLNRCCYKNNNEAQHHSKHSGMVLIQMSSIKILHPSIKSTI
jgi:hypothetical protein